MTDRIIRIKVDPSDANRGINQIDGNMRQLGSTTDRIQTQLTRVAQAIAAAFSVRQLVTYADAYTNIQNRLRVVTEGTEQLTRVTAELLQVANATRSEYEATATLFSTLTRSTQELGISEERLIAITSTINQSFAVAGASAQEASNAIRQLSQGLASGALRGDEFNSVAEQAPGILRAVAAETGKTVGELREFAAEGGITSELLIRAIENYSDTVQAEFAKTNRTFEQSATIARNNAVAFIGSSKSVQDATSAAGNALVFLSENLEALGRTFVAVSVVIGGSYVANLGSALAANIANTSATLNAAIAARTQAQAEFFAANGVRVKTVAVQQATAAQVAYAAASRAATGALSFLAGPAGLVLLAATAFAVFATEASKARQESANLETEINDLVSKFRELNEEGKALTFKKLSDEQADLLRQIAAAESEAAAARQRVTDAARASGGRLTASTNQAQAAVKKAEQSVALLNKRLDEVVQTQQRLFEVGLPSVDQYTDALNNANKKGKEFIQTLDLIKGLSKLFEPGEFNLFGETQTEQEADQLARINNRIQNLKLETQTISSELALQQGVRQGFLTQEQADLDLQTASKIQKAITERELLLAEKNITDEQILAAETAFQENLAAISQQYADRRIEIERLEKLTRIGLTQDFANAAIGVIAAFGSKSFQAQKNAAIATGVVNIAAGVAKALNNPYPANLGFAAQVAAQGAALISTIKSTNLNSGGGNLGSIGGAQTLPTTPESAPLVGSFEITGLSELQEQLDRLDPDEVLPVSFTRRLISSINSVQRLEGGG